jgi:hypothetical protein
MLRQKYSISLSTTTQSSRMKFGGQVYKFLARDDRTIRLK